MTNLERYKDDLIKIKGVFAVDRNTRKIVECSTLDCVDCIFNKEKCFGGNKIEWLCEEYKPSVLSSDELELIKALGKLAGINYKYVIKDIYGVIRFFETKPHVNKTGNYCGEYTYADIAGDKFSFLPNITHEDGLYDIENKCFIKEERED